MSKRKLKTLVTATGVKFRIHYDDGAWQCDELHTWQEGHTAGEWRCQNIVDMNQAGDWEDGIEREAYAIEVNFVVCDYAVTTCEET